MSLPSTWPYIVKVGSVRIPVYRVTNKKSGAEYTEFRVVWYDGDAKRRIKSFADFDEAKRHASTIQAAMSRGDMNAVSLTGDDRLAYLRAIESTKKFKIPLDQCAAEYSDARKRLGQYSLREAVDHFLKSRKATQNKPVGQIVDELIAEKRNPPRPTIRPASARYLADLESRLGRFREAFRCNLNDLTPKELEAFLNSLNVSGRTYFNYARTLLTLFNFAKARKYFPADANPFEGFSEVLEYADESEVQIFTPVELEKFLKHARPEMVLFLVLGAFAGLRSAEIGRLEWENIRERHIEITKGKAKTRQRRLVPIQPNLAAWLKLHQPNKGKVVTLANIPNAIQDLCAAAKQPWKHNALRHSYISYRFAITKNENEVSMEAGNSPVMIFRHYRELVTEAAAKAWFSIEPAQPAGG